MATLPQEQVTQRVGRALVTVEAGHHDTAAAETIWLSTTTLPYTVVLTTDNTGEDYQTVADRVDADDDWEPA